ncbi:MAG: GNAT family N-acetyltransferase [Solirubrobacteraceae bacterium]
MAVQEAARVADSPHWPSTTVTAFRARLRHGWDGDPDDVAVVRDADGRVVAVLAVGLPRWDNTHVGAVDVTVEPASRRRGLGRALFPAGVDKVREQGREVLMSGSFDHTSGVGFLEAMGLKRASQEAERRLDLWALDERRLRDEYAGAERVAGAYELVRMPGPVPDEHLDAVVAMTAAINDAPTDDLELEDEVCSPRRIRAFEAAQSAHGRRLYRLVARERSGGELAGHTMVAVESESPWWGWQFDTTVVPAHRGNRLGLLLKIAMLRWLATDEPQLRTVDTWNATSNTHMVHVNEVLGCHVVAHASEWQTHV